MSGRAIPKGSSIRPLDAAYLDRFGVNGDRCCVCGASAHDHHHNPPKSRIPRSEHHRIPTFTLCGFGNADGCHGLAHRQGGALLIQPPVYVDGEVRWYATAEMRATVAINASRKRAGLPPVSPSEPFFIGSEVR